MALRGKTAFWRVWVAQAISVSGDGMHRAALLWWAASTRSIGAVAVLALCSMVPLIACSPFAGVLADRMSRRRLMAGADGLRVVTSIALAAAVMGDGSPLWIVAALTSLAAVGEAAFAPAFTASLTQLLPEGDRASGNALNLANTAAGGLLGPSLGGLLVAVLGPASVLALDAVTFLVSAALIATTTIPAIATGSVDATSAPDDRERGWRIVMRTPQIRRLAVLASVLNLCTGPTSVLLVALVVDRLRSGSAVYGLLDACVAGGMLAGVVVVPRLARRSSDRSLLGGLVLLGAAFVAMGIVPHPLWSAAMFVIVGVGVAV
ncbi:unnamed protein product, partial [Phaeothamnion confervicola]